MQLLEDLGGTKSSGCHSSHLLLLIALQFLYLSWSVKETPILKNLGINCMFIFSSRKMSGFSEDSENQIHIIYE